MYLLKKHSKINILTNRCYQTKANLSTDGRPKVYGVWMKYGRKNPLLSTIPLEVFPNQFKGLWQTLQPPERGEDSDERPATPVPPEAWLALKQSGHNGLFLVLFRLFWWRHFLETIVDKGE